MLVQINFVGCKVDATSSLKYLEKSCAHSLVVFVLLLSRQLLPTMLQPLFYEPNAAEAGGLLSLEMVS